MVGRRRRQPLLLQRLRRDAVPAATVGDDRRRGRALGSRRSVRRAVGAEPVHGVVQAG